MIAIRERDDRHTERIETKRELGVEETRLRRGRFRDRDDGDRATLDDGARKMADTNDRGKDRDTYAEIQMTET